MEHHPYSDKLLISFFFNKIIIIPMSVVLDNARLKKFYDYLCDNYIDETS